MSEESWQNIHVTLCPRALIEMYWTYLYEFSFQYLLKLCKQIVNVNLLLLKFKLLSVI